MFGHQREILDAKNYENIRLLNIDRVTSKFPLYDVKRILYPWSTPAGVFQHDLKCMYILVFHLIKEGTYSLSFKTTDKYIMAVLK